MTTRHVLRTAGSTIVVALVLLAGCSGGADPSGETGSSSTVDPSSLEGACSLLVGPGATFVDDALAAGQAVADGRSSDADVIGAVQNDLFKIVTTGPAELQDAVGQLVDYLDDPAAYQTDGDVDALVTTAVDDIDRACA